MARTPFHHPRDAEYEPLTAEDDDNRSDDDASTPIIANDDSDDDVPFSWVEYSIFGLLGMAMLWAWNMFMAAAPYFSTRLVADPGLQSSFQSSVLTVFTATNLAAMLVLSHRQKSASYPLRINVALGVNMCVFLFLTASTTISDDVDEAPSPSSYFAFLLCMVFCSAWATGLVQNGAFAFAASFRRPEYMQALMAGQARPRLPPRGFGWRWRWRWR
ncbi:solute carrier family 29 (equilibrative nucleoside transporter), member 1/2/3 [Geosmithia morbida]|uniref:Solute carrier family 29 (Equilibrative nucleoside transporter), member 1/2/3 n=1 Tax=Geosmithia morbida TaxID=1094350 RepID=A0A9P5D2C3_9HYPO|nr:solute carrier family 29 (equilibrative nucleoside transporter), member 1/2/3 [Geosmithia morbida]KAF4121336.1 solute carrier family 29 (equilibrative nucleoside transporter), member 1/2/3 [Geosmithia morbida]